MLKAEPNLLHVALPDQEAATVERLATAFHELVADMVRRGFHGPHIAAALHQAAEHADTLAPEVKPGETLIVPQDADWHDMALRSYRTGHAEINPQIPVLEFGVLSGRTFTFAFEAISDLRELGDKLVAHATNLAKVAAERERMH
jgi:hypothetical protein